MDRQLPLDARTLQWTMCIQAKRLVVSIHLMLSFIAKMQLVCLPIFVIMLVRRRIDHGLGKSLYEARKKSGLSQEQVAEQLGISRQTVSKWELDIPTF